jgi:putative membrane-bound dehydrogenase-like protein
MKITLTIFSFLLLVSCAQEDPRQARSTFPHLDFRLHYDGRLYLPEGWTSTLWAESPQFYNPTNMDVDARGRIWITEAVNYRDYNNLPDQYPHFEAGDRVVILEDTDGDGQADSSKIFVQDEDLVSPLGIAVIGDKVVVSCSPNLIVYTDEDGDDRPDKKEILLTGFGGHDHDHGLHAFIAGPDGRWYFNTGNAGPHMVTDRSGWTLRSGSLYVGGSPYNTENSGGRRSDDGRVWVGGLALRIRPDGTGLEVLAHNFRNAYELAVDSYGDLWQNDNDDQVETCRSTWLMYGANAGYFSAGGTRYWQADRRPGQSTFAAHWHQDDPGVLPAGDNTGAGSPTGVLIYEGDAFGEPFRGMFLSADAGRNVIFAYQPRMQGAGFALKRKDLIASLAESTEGYIWHEAPEDLRKWFRPSDMVAGTDGALYIADWYDPVVGGHQMHDTTAYGRIYRIAPADRQLEKPAIDLHTTKGQIAALCNPAVNVRNLGFVKLLEQGEAVLPEVQQLLGGDNPFHRARAVWLMTQLGPNGRRVVEKLLKEELDPRLRIAAYRALTQAQPERLLPYARLSAGDPSPAVRRTVAVSLRDVPPAECQDIILRLYDGFDGKDRWYLEALGIALNGKEAAFYEEAIKDQPDNPLQWEEAFAALAWRLHPEAALDAFQTRALAETLMNEQHRQALTAIGFTPGAKAARTMLTIAETATHPRVKKLADWWVDFRRSNLWLDALDWKAQDQGRQMPDSIIRAERKLQEEKAALDEKIRAARTMAAHSEGGKLLLQHAATGRLPEAIYADASTARALFGNPEQEVRVLAGEYFPRPGGAILPVRKIVQLEGQSERGKALFEAKCSTCHRIGEVGIEIGPNLENIRRKFDKTALIDAIVNPNGGIAFGYEPVLITAKGDQVYSGFLLSEGEVIVIRDLAGNRHMVRSEAVLEKTVMNTSLMPDPPALGMGEQEVADVVAYLRGNR